MEHFKSSQLEKKQKDKDLARHIRNYKKGNFKGKQ
jgi:hypothetical protein